MEDYQALCRQLEAVECSIPTVGLVEETEERLVERISLYQVSFFVQAGHVCFISSNMYRESSETSSHYLFFV